MSISGYSACYRPLSPGPDNIRLLRLLPSKDENAPILCQLLEYSLQGFGRRGHQYECLSYCWGSSEKPCSIDIDGINLPITESLNGALIQLRDHAFERHLWIDAVCINQEDISEKEQQIQMMAKIYSQARQVVVWLGPEADDSDYAIELIRLAGAGQITRLSGLELSDEWSVLSSDYDSDETSVKSRNVHSDEASVQSSKAHRNEPSIDSNDDYRKRAAVTALLQRPWFRRIWLIFIRYCKEVAAAKHVQMVCGTSEIPGYSLCLGIDALGDIYKAQPLMKTLIYSVGRLIRGGFFRSNTDMVATNRLSLSIYPLGKLLDMYHTHQASLDHDKIYALLAMCSDWDDVRKAGIIPSYDIPWEHLMQNVCKYILGEKVVVRTWPGAALSILKSKGTIIGYITKVKQITVTDEEQDVILRLVVPSRSKTALRYIKAFWRPQASAHPVRRGDLVCQWEGSSKLAIIRTCENHFSVIAIAVTPPNAFQRGHGWSDVLLRLAGTVPVDLVLVWDWMRESDPQQNVKEHHVPLNNHEIQEYLQGEKTCYETGVRAAIELILGDEHIESSDILTSLLKFNQGIHITEDLLTGIMENRWHSDRLLGVVFDQRPKESILAATSESILVAAAKSVSSSSYHFGPMFDFLKYLGGDLHFTETVWLTVLSNIDGAYWLADSIVRAQGRIREPITEAMVLAAARSRAEPIELLDFLFKQNEKAGNDSRGLITEAVLKTAEENRGCPRRSEELYSVMVPKFLLEIQAEYAIK
ncbi:hypothetical protein CJF32_00004414 [Rutstroemia sp. NJR-2017a WRK4]|nr:hypothetical protein CJF32_00004414 [Rutstroemia sp. NJR-2017a WRK4]